MSNIIWVENTCEECGYSYHQGFIILMRLPKLKSQDVEK